MKQLNQNVSRISKLYSISINTTDEAAAQQKTAELDRLSTDTSALINTLKQRIEALEGEGTSGSYDYVKKQQEVCGFFLMIARDPEGLIPHVT